MPASGQLGKLETILLLFCPFLALIKKKSISSTWNRSPPLPSRLLSPGFPNSALLGRLCGPLLSTHHHTPCLDDFTQSFSYPLFNGDPELRLQPDVFPELRPAY